MHGGATVSEYFKAEVSCSCGFCFRDLKGGPWDVAAGMQRSTLYDGEEVRVPLNDKGGVIFVGVMECSFCDQLC